MISKTKCRLGANRETSPWKDDPFNFDSLITASKGTSCNAEWQNKISSLCWNTVARYSEEAPSILWVYHSYISVTLSTSCTNFTVNSKFSANRGSYLQCFSWLKHWTKRFCADFSRSVVNRMKWLRTKYTRLHLSTEWDCFSPENWTDFLPEEIQSKIVYIYSVINEYSLRSPLRATKYRNGSDL